MMKVRILSCLILMNFISRAQYLGPMDPELYQTLTVVERALFDACVKESGIPLDSMIWIQIGDSVYNEVVLDDGHTYHYSKRTIIENSDGEHWVLENKGSFGLEKPHFLVAIFHYSAKLTRVTLMMYY